MKRIAIIHPEGNFNNNPNLAGLLEILAESYRVDLYVNRSDIEQSHPHPNITVYPQSPRHAFMHDAACLLPSIAVTSPHEAAKSIVSQLNRPDIVIGVDRGIIEADALGQAWNIPCGLVSYEIYFADETSREFKLPEIIASSSVAFATCQDKSRASLLSRENEIPIQKFLYMPVAGRGTVPRKKSAAMHGALEIDPQRKLILYMGEISCAWSGIHQIIQHSVDWPEDWALILHHRYGNSAASDLITSIIGRKKKNIYFSPFPSLPRDQMAEILNCVDLGLAFYKPVAGHPLSGKNLEVIGLASGKISTYLQHGVPVLTNKLGEASELIAAYEAGASVQDASAITEALPALNGRELSENCYRLFSEKLDLDLTVRPLLNKLAEVLNARS